MPSGLLQWLWVCVLHSWCFICVACNLERVDCWGCLCVISLVLHVALGVALLGLGVGGGGCWWAIAGDWPMAMGVVGLVANAAHLSGTAWTLVHYPSHTDFTGPEIYLPFCACNPSLPPCGRNVRW